MGVWNKIKGFFGRVWGGIKKGASAVGKFLAGAGSKIYNTLKPAIGLLPGGGAITAVADKIIPSVATVANAIGNS